MTTRQTIQRFLAPVYKSKWSMLSMVFLDMFITIQMICLVYFVQYAVAALERQETGDFLFWIYMMIGISIVWVLAKIIWKPLAFKVFRDLWNAIDQLYLQKIIYGNNNKFEWMGTWRLIAVYSKWVDTWVDVTANMISEWFTTLLLFGSFLYTTWTKDIQFFRAILWALFLIFVWFYYIGWISYPWRAKSKTVEVEKQRMRVRWFMSKYEIMQSNKLASELTNIAILNHAWYSIKKIEKFYQWFAYDVPLFFASLLFAWLVYFAGQQVIAWTLSYSDITWIVWIWAIFIKDLDSLLRRIRVMVDKRIDISRLRELTDDLQTDHHDMNTWEVFLPKRKEIIIDALTYWYTSKEIVFSNFSLTITWSKKVALVGPSGGGKSTLIKLIAWYLHPDRGSILVDGQDLTQINLLSYYTHVGYLTQEPSVFDGTIRENLLYGMRDTEELSNEKTIEMTIPLAKCERIYELPNWLDTEIGERGIRLSGGQKQRLAIAKIMLKNPDIILLDEPTSALDSANEQAVTEALNNLFKNKTVIIIAHRLQTVKHADDIIYIADGKVVERGTHAELLALWWAYYKMVELQSGF